MIEFVIGVFMAVAVIEITTDVAGKAYDYVEPKVTELLSDEVTEEVQE